MRKERPSELLGNGRPCFTVGHGHRHHDRARHDAGDLGCVRQHHVDGQTFLLLQRLCDAWGTPELTAALGERLRVSASDGRKYAAQSQGRRAAGRGSAHRGRVAGVVGRRRALHPSLRLRGWRTPVATGRTREVDTGGSRRGSRAMGIDYCEMILAHVIIIDLRCGRIDVAQRRERTHVAHVRSPRTGHWLPFQADISTLT